MRAVRLHLWKELCLDEQEECRKETNEKYLADHNSKLKLFHLNESMQSVVM